MAEKFLTLMADLDDDTQMRLSEWYDDLKKAGFTGTQTPGLPYHISLETFSLDKEQEAVELTRKAAAEFSAIPVHISHIGLFAPGKVLFVAPERSAGLDALHNACEKNSAPQHLWTPHVTILTDEPDIICSALPQFVKSFHPFIAHITRLHLCAFWPTREILSIGLNAKI